VYGYRYVEQSSIPEPENIASDAEITQHRESVRGVRPPSLVSLGITTESARPHPDCSDSDTALAGYVKRFACEPPKPDMQFLRGLRKFTKRWVKKHLKPLAPDADTSVEAWLADTNYPEWRKQELRETLEEMTGKPWKEICKVKLFTKDECYPTYKHARGINSRHDAFKCMVGPIFKLIEKEVYEHPSFIKHVPVHLRAEYIQKKLARVGVSVAQTDYTAFEAHFRKIVMESCEFILYRYMVKNLTGGDDFMKLCEDVIAGRNFCVSKFFKIKIDARRMSGEMNTSLGNGFSNLMLMLYMLELKGCQNVDGVVEGDDGLFVFDGPRPSADDFQKSGFTIKLEYFDKLHLASFCGLIFDPEDMINIGDPMKYLVSFGWGSGKYTSFKIGKLRSLFRSKALSLSYQFQRCPILSALGRMGMRLTRGYNAHDFVLADRRMGQWEREQYLAAEAARKAEGIDFNAPIPWNTRMLCETVFGITVEHQIQIEDYLDSVMEWGILQHPLIDMYTPLQWKQYYGTYSMSVDIRSWEMREPPILASNVRTMDSVWTMIEQG
jgi:hypothetical protein